MEKHHPTTTLLARSSTALSLLALAMAFHARPAPAQASVQVLEIGVPRGAPIVLVASAGARASAVVRLQPRNGDAAVHTCRFSLPAGVHAVVLDDRSGAQAGPVDGPVRLAGPRRVRLDAPRTLAPGAPLRVDCRAGAASLRTDASLEVYQAPAAPSAGRPGAADRELATLVGVGLLGLLAGALAAAWGRRKFPGFSRRKREEAVAGGEAFANVVSGELRTLRDGEAQLQAHAVRQARWTLELARIAAEQLRVLEALRAQGSAAGSTDGEGAADSSAPPVEEAAAAAAGAGTQREEGLDGALAQLAAMLPTLAAASRQSLVEKLDRARARLQRMQATADQAWQAAGGAPSDERVERFRREWQGADLWLAYLRHAIASGYLPLVAHLHPASETSLARRIAIDMRCSADLLNGSSAPVDDRLDALLIEHLLPILRAANASRGVRRDDWAKALEGPFGLEPFGPARGDRFQGQLHETPDGTAGASVSGTLAPGYARGGSVLLRAVVSTSAVSPAGGEGGRVNAVRIAPDPDLHPEEPSRT